MVKTSQRKLLVPLAIFFSLLPSAQAAIGDIGNVGDAIIKLFYPIFGANLLESSNFVFWAKLLIWILLFAVFFWVFRMVFKEHKNIAITVAGVVSAISSLGLPESMLRGVIESYTLVSTFILYIAPIGGLLWLMYTVFGADTRVNHAIKAVLFFLLAALLVHFSFAMQAMAGIPSFNFTQGIASLATSVCILMGIYHIIRAIFAGPAGAVPTAPTLPGGTTPPGAPRTVPPVPPVVPPVTPPPDFARQLQDLQEAINNYNHSRETEFRVPAIRDLLNANHARGGGGYSYAYSVPPLDWDPYNAAWAHLEHFDTQIRAIITALQGHAEYPNITNAQAAQLDNLITQFTNALNVTTQLLNEFSQHLGRGEASPW